MLLTVVLFCSETHSLAIAVKDFRLDLHIHVPARKGRSPSNLFFRMQFQYQPVHTD